MFLPVIRLNKLVVAKTVLFSVGLKIQNGWQSWSLIAANNYSCYINHYFERNCIAINKTNPSF